MMSEFDVLAHGLFGPDQVIVEYQPRRCIHLTKESQIWADGYWQEQLQKAAEEQRLLFDAPLYRLLEVRVEHERLHITLGDTSYKEYVTTRVPAFTQGRERDELGNPFAVCSVIETSDGFILLDRRQGVDVYVGRYHVIGGFVERDVDGSAVADCGPDPFAAIQREIREETGIQAADIQEQYCLGAVYDKATPHGELIFFTRLHIPLAEVRQRQAEDNEIKVLHTLQVTEASLREWLTEHKGHISVTGEANLLLYGAWKFGEQWLKHTLSPQKPIH